MRRQPVTALKISRLALTHACTYKSPSPMDETNSLIQQRRAKLEALRAKGIDPCHNNFERTGTIAEAHTQYAEGKAVAVAGRIMTRRDMGKSEYMHIKDQYGTIQIYAQKNVLGDEGFDTFKHLDLGDIIGV